MTRNFVLIMALLPSLIAASETSVEELIARLMVPKQGNETQEFELGEKEANAWAAEAIAKQPKLGVKSLDVDFREPNTIATEVVVNMDQVELGGYTATLIGSSLSGFQTLEVVGQLEVREGKGQYSVETAMLNGVAVPAWLANTILSYLSKNQPPNVDVTEPFSLPYGISSVRLTPDTIVIVR
jgi:hypothetical protein